METRTVSTDALSVRSTAERIIEGRLVPYGETIDHAGRRERFTRGAFAKTDPHTVALKVEHTGLPVGRGIELVEDDAGATAAFRVANTPRGDEILELAAAGAMRGVSIGFIPGHAKLVGDVVEHRRVTLIEASIVERPAYVGAAVTQVRTVEPDPSKPDPKEAPAMTDTPTLTEPAAVPAVVVPPAPEPATAAALELRNADLEARLRILESRPAVAAAPADVATLDPLVWFGAELRAAMGDDVEKRALADMVGVTGGTDDAGGIVPAAYDPAGLVSVLDARRPMFANAGRIGYPASGTNLTLPVVTTQPTVAAHVQKAEAESTAMVIGTETFPITFGAGAQNVALELVAQSNPQALSVLWDSLLRAYAGWSETFAEAIVAALAAETGAALDLTDLGTFITDVVTQSEAIYDATGSPGDKLALPTDDWIKLLSLTDGADRRQLATLGAQNADGSASLTAEAFNFAGITVFHMPKRISSVAIQFNTAALKTADSGPNRLEAVNVANIGRDVAVWGGIIVAAVIPAGVIKYKLTA